MWKYLKAKNGSESGGTSLGKRCKLLVIDPCSKLHACKSKKWKTNVQKINKCCIIRLVPLTGLCNWFIYKEMLRVYIKSQTRFLTLNLLKREYCCK